MAEEFEDRDLSDAVFWGVKLQRALFRDADFAGARFFHTAWSDVSIDGVVDRLVVNGVDVTDFVNGHDRWYPLRTKLEPATEDELREAWTMLRAELSAFRDRASRLDAASLSQSVNGEWSLRDTLRHLVFVFDKWFTWPILGERTFAAVGLPNSGSQGGDWPGIDPSLDPDIAAVRREHEEQMERFTRYLDHVDFSALPATTDVLENGPVPSVLCFHVVLEEHFEHLRYALRDLDAIEAS